MARRFSTLDHLRREVAEHVGIGGIGPVLVGSVATVCDALERWVEATDIDGFNLCYVVAHETFADVVDQVVPELQRRGRYRTAYEPGVLGEKLFERGRPHVRASHPAAPAGLAAARSLQLERI